jgi:fluoride ion exporter CrcB/FEX
MGKLMDELSGYDTLTAKSSIRLLCWTFAWAGTMVVADKAELYQWHSSTLISILAIAVNAAIGLGVIVTYIRFLKELDDLERKIQFDALALSVGIGLVGGFTICLLEAADFISDAEATDIIMLLALTYSVALIVGKVRYR